MGSEKEKFQRNVKVTKAPESDGDKRPEEGGGYKILIVDDEPDILDSLIFLLEKTDKFDAEIKTASSGDKALVEIEKRKFDLVLADYKMPGMNGIELLEKVRKRHPRTIRILITGYSDVKIAKEAINRAAVHLYLEKPWDNDDLRLTIRTALERKKERETSQIRLVKKMKDAVKLLKSYKGELTSLPGEHISQELIMLQFDDVTEFNNPNSAI